MTNSPTQLPLLGVKADFKGNLPVGYIWADTGRATIGVALAESCHSAFNPIAADAGVAAPFAKLASASSDLPLRFAALR